MRDAPAVCESLADFNASVIPLLARSTAPAIKFPKSEKPNKLLPANALLSPMQITPQCALIVREAGTWSRWISHCQSIPNWICHIMLCQLFLRIHLTDKTIIKLMQCSQQNSLAVWVEMKPRFPLFLGGVAWAEPNKSRRQRFSWMILTRAWQGQDQAACLHANENDAFFFSSQTWIRLETSPWNGRFNGNVLSFEVYLHILM